MVRNIPIRYLAPGSLRFPQDSIIKRNYSDPLELNWISLNINENTASHHTQDFDVVQKQRNPHLVIRRGQEFLITLCFYRDFNAETDKLSLIFELGA